MVSIDAAIAGVERLDNGDVVLHLENAIHSDGKESIRGQNKLTILNATYTPRIGQEIWGGSGLCILGGLFEDKKLYRRIGYTKLEEAFEEAPDEQT